MVLLFNLPGYFAPLTEEGQLEVGGVSASCYIEICLFGWKVPHHVMNVVMWPFRVNPAWMPKAWRLKVAALKSLMCEQILVPLWQSESRLICLGNTCLFISCCIPGR